jgi:hypothetical protein
MYRRDSTTDRGQERAGEDGRASEESGWEDRGGRAFSFRLVRCFIVFFLQPVRGRSLCSLLLVRALPWGREVAAEAGAVFGGRERRSSGGGRGRGRGGRSPASGLVSVSALCLSVASLLPLCHVCHVCACLSSVLSRSLPLRGSGSIGRKHRQDGKDGDGGNADRAGWRQRGAFLSFLFFSFVRCFFVSFLQLVSRGCVAPVRCARARYSFAAARRLSSWGCEVAAFGFGLGRASAWQGGAGARSARPLSVLVLSVSVTHRACRSLLPVLSVMFSVCACLSCLSHVRLSCRRACLSCLCCLARCRSQGLGAQQVEKR